MGDFDGTGPVDLAVGAPFEVYDGDGSGVVKVFRGRAGDLGTGSFITSDGFLHQEWVVGGVRRFFRYNCLK